MQRPSVFPAHFIFHLNDEGKQICPGCRKELVPEGHIGSVTMHSDDNGAPWHIECYRAAGKLEYVPPKRTFWQRVFGD